MRDTTALAAIASLGTLLLSGCASLNSSVPFQYQPSLTTSGKQIQKTVGFNMLVDERPEKDRAYTKSIKDVPEKLTAKLIEDFERSKVFKEVHYPPREGDDIVVGGTINRFMWKLYATPITYIPYLNLIILFGIPAQEAYGITDLQLELRDKATNELLGNFSASSKVETSYTVYNFKAGEAGTELAESLRDVAKKLKGDIASRLQ